MLLQLRAARGALPGSKHELAQEQPEAESNHSSRGNRLQDVRHVQRLNTWIS
jgi:hypothetical protein